MTNECITQASKILRNASGLSLCNGDLEGRADSLKYFQWQSWKALLEENRKVRLLFKGKNFQLHLAIVFETNVFIIDLFCLSVIV